MDKELIKPIRDVTNLLIDIKNNKEAVGLLKDIKNIMLLKAQNEKLQHMELIKEIRGIKSQLSTA